MMEQLRSSDKRDRSLMRESIIYQAVERRRLLSNNHQSVSSNPNQDQRKDELFRGIDQMLEEKVSEINIASTTDVTNMRNILLPGFGNMHQCPGNGNEHQRYNNQCQGSSNLRGSSNTFCYTSYRNDKDDINNRNNRNGDDEKKDDDHSNHLVHLPLR